MKILISFTSLVVMGVAELKDDHLKIAYVNEAAGKTLNVTREEFPDAWLNVDPSGEIERRFVSLYKVCNLLSTL